VDIAGAMPTRRNGLACSVLPGSENRAKGHWVVREPGRPCLPPCGKVRKWGPDYEPQARGLVSWTAGSKTPGTPQGIAKRRQRSAARGAQGVAQRHSTVEAGELASEDPGKGRALPTGGPTGGKQGKHSVASFPVTVTSLDSVRGAWPASAEVLRPCCEPARGRTVCLNRARTDVCIRLHLLSPLPRLPLNSLG
jgi:hypothetical protein